MKSTIQSGRTLISSTSAAMKHSENSEEPLLQTSKSDTGNNVEMGTKQTRECNITSKKDETVRQHAEGSDKKPSLPATHRAVPHMKTNIKYTTRKNSNYSKTFNRKVLSIAQEEEVYPWQKEASHNRLNKSSLSKKVQKIPENANKLLQPAMKSKLYQQIDYPDHINRNINNKIEKQGQNYICIDCANNPPYSSTRRNMVIRHVTNELGYCKFRCSFCDEISNNTRSLIHHYASTHGIPSNWLQSN